MIKVRSFVFNPFMENTLVVFDDTKEAIIVDPGCYESAEREELKEFIEVEGLKVVRLVNTHCHIDHVLGNYFVKQSYDVPLLICKKDLETLKAVKVYAPSYGFTQYSEALPDEYIEDGDFIEFGNTRFTVLFVPGHAPGHIALYNPESKIVISGDVLFKNSIGRTDLPGGNYDTLIESIKSIMYGLPEDTTVYCGHGESTTIGDEMRTNQFCKVL